MITIGFVGSSGTGKSYRAISVAKNNEIEYLIDDGLFINAKTGKVEAGISAKREPTKLASVRRALFVEDFHIEGVVRAIKKANPEKIMILGTSDQMVHKIAEVLCLPKISNIIRIEDVATADEIKEAVKIRREQGKHIIPVPTFEIKKDFSGYFIDTLRTFGGKGRQKTIIAEKTVVRPTFSYLGEYHLSEKVLAAICKKAASDSMDVYKCNKVVINDYGNNGVIIDMDITAVYGENLVEAARQAQKNAKAKIEELTSVNVLLLNVTVKAVVVDE